MAKNTFLRRHPDDSAAAAPRRAFTAKSILFGLVGVLLIAAGAGYHHTTLGYANRLWLVSNHLPPIVFGYLMLLGLGWNGVMQRLSRRLALNSRELVVVMTMCFMACFPASAGLWRYTLRMMILPWQCLVGAPDWASQGLLEELLSPKLFPAPVPFRDPVSGALVLDDRVYRSFVNGIAHGSDWAAMSEIPWSAWLPPMMYWGPLIVAFAIAVMSLAFLVHRQWAENEQLSYPIAQIADGFCGRADGLPGVPDIYRSPLFWSGFAVIFLLYALEYAHAWHPEVVPSMNDFMPNLKRWELPVLTTFPALKQGVGGGYLNGQRLSFAIVGISFFVSSEVSLSLGLSQILLSLFGLAVLQSTGVPLRWVEMCDCRAGAYVGYAAFLLFTGRTYFRAVALQAFVPRRWLGAGGRAAHARAAAFVDPAGILAARMLALATVAFVVMLRIMGSDWAMAVIFALTTLLLFLVFTRVVCETGLPFLQTDWTPVRLMAHLLGPSVIGARSLTFLQYTHVMLAQDPRECLMPYVATSVKVSSDARLPLRRVYALLSGALGIALVVSFVFMLWSLYNVGGTLDNWSGRSVPPSTFNTVSTWLHSVTSLGELGAAESMSALGRWSLASAAPASLRWFLYGAAMVAAFALLRLRFTRFPFHPVLFLVWGTWPAGITWASFSFGWFVKTLVVKFGGGRAYQRLKPVFIGLIAGELVAIVIAIVIDLAYYWTTGEPTGISYEIQVN